MRSFAIVLALVLMLVFSFSEASVGLIVRTDYVNVRATQANNLPVDVPGRSDFVLSLMKLNGYGKVAGGELYMSLNPLKSEYLPVEGSAGLVHILYFMKPFYNDWWFKIGRLPNMIGGFEAIYISAGDDHWGSLANSNPKLDSTAPSGDRVGRLGNVSGIAVGFDREKTSFEFQVLDDLDSGNDPDTSPNTSHSYGAIVNRSIGSNLWVKVHAFVYRLDDAVTDVDLFYRGLGLRWKSGRQDLTFDYLMNGYRDLAAGSSEDQTNSLVLNYRFAWTDQKVPFLKLEASEILDKPSGSFDMKRTAITAGMDYVPKSSEAFRYHVAASLVTDDYITDRDVVQPRFLAGLRYEVDLLK